MTCTAQSWRPFHRWSRWETRQVKLLLTPRGEVAHHASWWQERRRLRCGLSQQPPWNISTRRTPDVNETMLPCPFCGSFDVDPEGWLGTEEGGKEGEFRRGPECMGCGATTVSVEAWNRRPVHSAPFSHLPTDSRTLLGRLSAALAVIESSGGVDGAHHKMWVIDQVVRELTGNDYPAWVAQFRAGEDGPHTYNWDEGIPP